MIVPIESPFYAISYGSTNMDQMLALNLTNDEFCLQLKSNLTELERNQVDWASYGCTILLEHAPQLNDKIIVKVIVLSLMGIMSLIGNIATIWNIQKNRATRRALRHSCSAIYALILHLSVADILVTFFCIIGEALWSYTVEWLAGDLACKLVKIGQMFSLYLSTNVLVLIGIDRWVAVKYPMKSKFLNTARFLVSIIHFTSYVDIMLFFAFCNINICEISHISMSICIHCPFPGTRLCYFVYTQSTAGKFILSLYKLLLYVTFCHT